MRKKRYLLIGIILVCAAAIIYALQPKEGSNKEGKNEEGITVTSVMPQEKEETNQRANVSKSKAEEIAQGALEDYQVVSSEQRSSTGEDYYLVTMQKGEEVVHVYVDSETGEILYQD